MTQSQKEFNKTVCFQMLDGGHAHIEHLVYLALQLNTDVYKDEILWNLSAEELHDVFPNIPMKHCTQAVAEDEAGECIHEYGYLGFIAQVHFRKGRNFSFRKDGSFRSCSLTPVFKTQVLYGESIEELLMKIRCCDKEIWNAQLADARKKQGINATGQTA